MRLSKRLVLDSCWEGLITAHWWVDLGLVPLVSRAMLGKTLSSLTADGWGYVPALFVVWPEVPSTSLQAVG